MLKKIALYSFLLMKISFADTGIYLAPVKHVYVPAGYDSNDAVEVVVTGNFPNPCYSRNTVSVEVVDEKINIEVTAIYPSQKENCPEFLVPFKEVVAIGNLQGGDYKISVNNKLFENLKVLEAQSNAVDNHLYAAINHLEKKSNNSYVLHGWRYSACLELDKIEVFSNGKDTLSVLPIMKQVSDFCPMKGVPVSYPVKLNFKGLKMREPLIHVRTMDGMSFNTILKI